MRGAPLSETKRVVNDFFQKEDHNSDDIVRQKILSSRYTSRREAVEWDVLYRKYFEEETRKQKSRAHPGTSRITCFCFPAENFTHPKG